MAILNELEATVPPLPGDPSILTPLDIKSSKFLNHSVKWGQKAISGKVLAEALVTEGEDVACSVVRVIAVCRKYKGGHIMVYNPGSEHEIHNVDKESHSDYRSSTYTSFTRSKFLDNNLDSSFLADHCRSRKTSTADKDQTCTRCSSFDFVGSIHLCIDGQISTPSNALQEMMHSEVKVLAEALVTEGEDVACSVVRVIAVCRKYKGGHIMVYNPGSEGCTKHEIHNVDKESHSDYRSSTYTSVTRSKFMDKNLDSSFLADHYSISKVVGSIHLRIYDKISTPSNALRELMYLVVEVSPSQTYSSSVIIPAKGQLKSLQLLNLSNNRLTSSIPAEYAKSRSFQIMEKQHLGNIFEDLFFDEESSSCNFTATSSTGCHPINQPSLSITRADMEFSWHKNTLYGKKITPRVRKQRGKSCVLNALAGGGGGGGEMELKRKSALKKPSETCDIEFLIDSFIQDYEKIAGGTLGSAEDKFRKTRRKEVLKMFVRDGVLAKEANGSVRRIRLSGYEWKDGIDFDEVANIIRQGKPLVGSVLIDSNFAALRGREIYNYNPNLAKKTMGGAPVAHALLFIGFGVRGGRTYLVFLNSHGKKFGEKGIGRVYFYHVKNLNTMEF